MTTRSDKLLNAPQQNLVFAITFVAGLALGILAVIAIQNFNPQDELATLEVTLRDAQRTSSMRTDETSNESTVEVGKFEEIFKHRNVFEQSNALYSALASASKEDLRDWWIQSQAIERKSYREIAQDAILRHLTTINPQEALRYIDDVSIFRSDVLLKSVFSEWSIAQLDQAIEVAATLSSPQRKVALESILETRDDLSESRLRSIAGQLEGEDIYLKLVSDTKASQRNVDPQESWDMLLKDEVDDYLQVDSLSKVAEAWRKQVDFEVLSKIYHSEIRNNMVGDHLVSVIAQVDSAGALTYTRGLLEENEKWYLASIILREWARTDAQAALAIASTFEPVYLASDLEREIVYAWARTEPNEVIENIETISKEAHLLTVALETAFSEIAREKPLEAISELSTIEKYVGNTSSILKNIVFQWSLQKPDAAADWVINNIDRHDPQHRALLRIILPHLARQKPAQAFEVAIAHATPNQGRGLEQLVIGVIAQDGNIDLAKTLLPRVNENDRPYAYAKIGSAMISQGRTSDALELGNDLAETDQTYYFNRVMSTWASTQPTILYESLEDLPTSSIKSHAAMLLIDNNRLEPVLTDDQIARARTLLRSNHRATLKREENR